MNFHIKNAHQKIVKIILQSTITPKTHLHQFFRKCQHLSYIVLRSMSSFETYRRVSFALVLMDNSWRCYPSTFTTLNRPSFLSSLALLRLFSGTGSSRKSESMISAQNMVSLLRNLGQQASFPSLKCGQLMRLKRYSTQRMRSSTLSPPISPTALILSFMYSFSSPHFFSSQLSRQFLEKVLDGESSNKKNGLYATMKGKLKQRIIFVHESNCSNSAVLRQSSTTLRKVIKSTPIVAEILCICCFILEFFRNSQKQEFTFAKICEICCQSQNSPLGKLRAKSISLWRTMPSRFTASDLNFREKLKRFPTSSWQKKGGRQLAHSTRSALQRGLLRQESKRKPTDVKLNSNEGRLLQDCCGLKQRLAEEQRM